MAQAQTIARDTPRAGGANANRAVRMWLFAVAALVFLMVSLGGATRLTGSGLSITEWKPIMGAIPPLTEAHWLEAFAKYKQIPQYHHVNTGMSLEAFKAIFWWEWTHRFLGRLIGVAFFVPLLYFALTRRIGRAQVGRLAGIFVLGGVQGAVGWYMVSSGLADRIDVSQYRLALHLALAILILGLLLWAALSLEPGADEPGVARTTTWAGWLIAGLVFVQIVLGALVAGLRAGLAYNTWPLMEGRLVPPGLDAMQPWYLNLFENALTVQFNHRMAAYALLAVVLWQALRLASQAPGTRAALSALVLAAAVVAQAVLGICTLVMQVPIGLALAHQAGAAAVFSVAVWHLYAGRERSSP